MGVYEDMANDAGYAYGSDENQMMSDSLQQQEMEAMQEHDEMDEFLNQLGGSGPLVQREIERLSAHIKKLEKQVEMLRRSTNHEFDRANTAEAKIAEVGEMLVGLRENVRWSTHLTEGVEDIIKTLASQTKVLASGAGFMVPSAIEAMRGGNKSFTVTHRSTTSLDVLVGYVVLEKGGE